VEEPSERHRNDAGGGGILKKMFREDDKKTFFFVQEGRKKSLISNQVLIFLGWLWRKKIKKLWNFRTARG